MKVVIALAVWALGWHWVLDKQGDNAAAGFVLVNGVFIWGLTKVYVKD